MIRQCMSLRHPVYKEIPRSRIFGLFVSRALGRVDELAAGPHGLQIQRASSVVASQQNVGLLPLLERANARAAHTWPHKYLGSHRLLSTHRRSDRSNDNWELTVGIEVHAQLNTDLKLFSSTYIITHHTSLSFECSKISLQVQLPPSLANLTSMCRCLMRPFPDHNL